MVIDFFFHNKRIFFSMGGCLALIKGLILNPNVNKRPPSFYTSVNRGGNVF